MKRVRKRQLNFLGQIVRAEELESDCLLGRIDGTRAIKNSGRKTWTAFWASLVEARRQRTCSDWGGNDETEDLWSTTSQDNQFCKVRVPVGFSLSPIPLF